MTAASPWARTAALLFLTAAVWADPVAVSSTAVVHVSTTPAVQLLTLPQCVTLALDHASAVLKGKNEVELSGTALLQAYLQFLPNLETQANYGWTRGREYFTSAIPTIVDTTNHGGDYTISSTLNIFNGFGDYSGLKASGKRRTDATLSLYRAKQQIQFDITQAYMQVLLDRQIVRINEENLKASREREEVLSEQTRVGIHSLADLYRQQAQTSADGLALINAQTQTRNDLILLLRRVRVDLMQHYDLADAAIDVPPTVDPYTDESALLHRAIAQRADLAASRAGLQAEQWDVVTARSGYYPRLDLAGSLNGAGRILSRQDVNGVSNLPAAQDPLLHQLGDQIVYNAGLTLTWGLFDRYLTRLSVARAEETARNARVDDEDLLLQVEGDVQQVLGDYHAALDQLQVSAVGVRAAQESMDAVNARYEVGASNIVDLLTAQSALVLAQGSDAQAHIGYMLQKRLLDNVLGDTPVPH